VLVTLAAAGRNPTDITIPTQAGTEGSDEDEEDDDEDVTRGTSSANASSATGTAAQPMDDSEGGGTQGSHLTDEQVTILLANGYTQANIMVADEALANGVSFDDFLLLLGGRPQAQPVKQPPPDPNAGIAQAADFLEAVGKGFLVAGKQVVLGEFSEEQNDLGDTGQVLVGLTGLDTAADIRDIAAAAEEVRANPDNPAANLKPISPSSTPSFRAFWIRGTASIESRDRCRSHEANWRSTPVIGG
jgi:hypothetical protein